MSPSFLELDHENLHIRFAADFVRLGQRRRLVGRAELQSPMWRDCDLPQLNERLMDRFAAPPGM